jgi:hypothetical protein
VELISLPLIPTRKYSALYIGKVEYPNILRYSIALIAPSLSLYIYIHIYIYVGICLHRTVLHISYHGVLVLSINFSTVLSREMQNRRCRVSIRKTKWLSTYYLSGRVPCSSSHGISKTETCPVHGTDRGIFENNILELEGENNLVVEVTTKWETCISLQL